MLPFLFQLSIMWSVYELRTSMSDSPQSPSLLSKLIQENWRSKFRLLVRFMFGYALGFKQRAWLQYVQLDPTLKVWSWQDTATIVFKVQRHYMRKKFKAADKYEVMTTHFDWFTQHFVPAIGIRNQYEFLPLFSMGNLVLPNLSEQEPVALPEVNIQLQVVSNSAQEGELAMHLLDPDGRLIHFISFTVAHSDGKQVLMIGGSQGGRDIGPDYHKQLSKAWFGLFPKDVAMICSQAFAEYFGMAQLLAPTKATHCLMVKKRKRSRDTVQTDLDGFFAQYGELNASQEDFVIDAIVPEKDLTKVASKRRSLYRKRYALEAALRVATLEALDQMLKKEPVPQSVNL